LGQTPLDTVVDEKVRQVLIENGARKGTRGSTKFQDYALPIDLNDQTHEFSFDANPVSDEEIKRFCQEYIEYVESDLYSKEFQRIKLEEGIKEVCQLPTGRMAFWVTKSDIDRKRKSDGKYKINFGLGEATGLPLGMGGSAGVYINMFHINRYNNSKECAIMLGQTFFHEMQHVRQREDGKGYDFGNDLQYMDAAPHAFNRQLAVEAPYPYIRIVFNISERERKQYEQAVEYDPQTGSFNVQKASAYSRQMQQQYTMDFLTGLDKTPFVTHSLLSSQFNAYMIRDIVSSQLKQENRNPAEEIYRYLENKNFVKIQQTDPLDTQVYNALQPLAEQINVSLDQEEMRRPLSKKTIQFLMGVLIGILIARLFLGG
jgi:hypothetical protein